MNRRITSIILLFITALQLHAVTVTTNAGKLASVVTDNSITQLTINGTIDARDFKFITDALEGLKILDLSGAYIVAYNSTLSDGLLAGEYHHANNTLPYCALTGMVSLTSLTLPCNLIAIDYGALAGCSKLASIELPSTLKSIGDDAFNSCTSLKTVSFHSRLTHLGNSAFAHCRALTEIRLLPKEPLVIGDNAFADCTSLTKVILGANITKIGDGAFNGCTALNQFYLMDESKLEDIGDKAFYNSTLEQIDFSRTPLLKHLGAWSLARTRLKKLNIPAHVKSLDEGTLFYNTRLTTLELPKTLNYLPDYMLAGCDKINGTPFITQNLGNIGDFAIYNQSQHTSITIPYKVYYLGTQAMAGMTGLTEITSEPIKVPELGDDVWAGINQGQVKLNVKEESINDYQAAEQWQDFLVGVAQFRGDVNCDGYVNTLDAIGERRFLVEGITEGINLNRTDVTGNGRIDVADIVAIYNIINGTEPSEHPAQYWFSDNIESFGSSTVSRKAKIEISLENTVNYTAFQFDIITPSHITIDGATISNRGIGHEAYVGEVGNNQYRLVCYSPAGDDLEGYEGLLVTLNVSSTRTIDNNDFITLKPIYFVDYKENIYYNNSNLDINILGFSSIDNITVDENNKPVNVYNTQGQLLRQGVMPYEATNGLPSGIYIVGNKKVIVR